MDHAGEKMNVVMEALGKLLKTKDGCQIWTIVILAGILILLGEWVIISQVSSVCVSIRTPVCLYSVDL
jgi:hypothetical protein